MLRWLTGGDSHGPHLTAIIDGLPAGLPVHACRIDGALARRQRGHGRGGRMQIEHDTVELAGGVRGGRTTGAPVVLTVRNRDGENWEASMRPGRDLVRSAETRPRPGHADLAGVLKYELDDIVDISERASARETAVCVAAASLVGELLRAAGITVASHVVSIGDVSIAADWWDVDDEYLAAADLSPVRCGDRAVAERMVAAIDAARADGDSIGGTVAVIARGVVPGLGTHAQSDRRLDGRLAAAIMAIPAIKGVEIGPAFANSALPGSAVHDQIYPGQGTFLPERPTNRAGGLEGGISNGSAIALRAAMKPIPSLTRPLASIDLRSGETTTAAAPRADACAVPAAAVTAEAVVTLALARELLDKFGGDSFGDYMRNLSAYRERLARGDWFAEDPSPGTGQ